MPVLGDNPMTLINIVANNLFNGLSGGEPIAIGAICLVILMYFAVHFKLDRGAITFMGLLFISIMFIMGLIPDTIFWVVVGVSGLLIGFGMLNAARQGES